MVASTQIQFTGSRRVALPDEHEEGEDAEEEQQQESLKRPRAWTANERDQHGAKEQQSERRRHRLILGRLVLQRTPGHRTIHSLRGTAPVEHRRIRRETQPADPLEMTGIRGLLRHLIAVADARQFRVGSQVPGQVGREDQREQAAGEVGVRPAQPGTVRGLQQRREEHGQQQRCVALVVGRGAFRGAVAADLGARALVLAVALAF